MLLFYRLLASQALFRLSIGLAATALPTLAAMQSGVTATGMSLISLAKTIPYIVLAPLFGRISGRVDKYLWLIVAEMLASAVAATVAWTVSAGAVDIRLFVMISFAFGALAVAIDVVLTGWISMAVIESEKTSLNGWVQTTNSSSDIFSAALAGQMLSLFGGASIFILSAMSLFGAAALALGGRRLRTASTSPEQPAPTAPPKYGIAAILSNRRIRALLAPMALWNGLHSAMMAMLAIFVLRVLRLPVSTVGFIFAATGFGMLGGGLAASRLPEAFRSARAIGPTLLLGGLSWLSVAHAGQTFDPRLSVLIAFSVFGFVMALCMVAGSTLRQAAFPKEGQTSLASFQMWVNWSAMATGFALGGLLGDRFGIEVTLQSTALLTLLPGAFLTYYFVFTAPRRDKPATVDLAQGLQ